MTQRAPGRKSALTALTAVALLALGALAPVASAQISTSQIPAGDPVGSVTETVGGVTGGGGDSGGSTSGGGGSSVGSTTGTVTDTVDKTVGTTTGTTGNVGSTTGGVGAIVDSTDDTVKQTTEQTKKTVGNTTSNTGSTVNQTINDAGDAGGNVTNPLLNAKDPQAKDVNGDGRISNKERNTVSGGDTSKAAYGGGFAGDRTSRKATDGSKFGSLAAAERTSRNAFSSTPAFAVAPPRQGLLAQAAELVTAAAEKLAFPLGLALMVGAFLMLQGRIDRKDAKLVLAPIDSEQDLLSFQ